MEATVSQLLRRQLAVRTAATLTIGDFLQSVEEQGFGLLLIAFALPVLVPLPPGVGAIPGVILMMWGLQRLAGRHTPWLPQRIQARPLTPRMTLLLETKAIPVLERMERVLPQGRGRKEPREWESRVAALVVVLMGFLVLLPTPFLNTLPSLIIIGIGLSYVNHHRILMWTSIALGSVVFGALLVTVALGGEMLLDEIREEGLAGAAALSQPESSAGP